MCSPAGRSGSYGLKTWVCTETLTPAPFKTVKLRSKAIIQKWEGQGQEGPPRLPCSQLLMTILHWNSTAIRFSVCLSLSLRTPLSLYFAISISLSCPWHGHTHAHTYQTHISDTHTHQTHPHCGWFLIAGVRLLWHSWAMKVDCPGSRNSILPVIGSLAIPGILPFPIQVTRPFQIRDHICWEDRKVDYSFLKKGQRTASLDDTALENQLALAPGPDLPSLSLHLCPLSPVPEVCIEGNGLKNNR